MSTSVNACVHIYVQTLQADSNLRSYKAHLWPYETHLWPYETHLWPQKTETYHAIGMRDKIRVRIYEANGVIFLVSD